MDIKYYDFLSNTIIGVTIVATINYLFIGNIEIDGVVYLALGAEFNLQMQQNSD